MKVKVPAKCYCGRELVEKPNSNFVLKVCPKCERKKEHCPCWNVDEKVLIAMLQKGR